MMSMLKADHKMKRGQSADYTEVRFAHINCVKTSVVPSVVVVMFNGFKA